MIIGTNTTARWIAKLLGTLGGASGMGRRRPSGLRREFAAVAALEQLLLLDSPIVINPMVQPGSSGIDGLAILITGRELQWNSGTSVAIGTLTDAPLDWWMPSTISVSGWITSVPPQGVTTYRTPHIIFNQVRGLTGATAWTYDNIINLGGSFTPGEWSQGGNGTGLFSVNTPKDFVTSKVSLTTSNGCNTVIDDETWEGGSDAGKISVSLHDFAPGSYSVTFQVITIFSVSGGGAGGSVSITGGINHSVSNPGATPLTTRFADTVQRTIQVGDSGTAIGMEWTPTIGMNLSTIENVTIEGHIALTAISKQ